MTRYDYDFDVNADSVAGRVVRLVGRDLRVLELGCSSGHMSQVFHSRGCQVTGLEIDPQAAELARQWCESVYITNLDEPDWSEQLKDVPLFDVAVAADVLEHLRDPQACLAQLRRLLKPGGRIVLSTPNIAHGGVVAGLLQGQFNYRSTGLLDSTHVHFFTGQSLREALESAGFVLEHLSPVEAGSDHPEFSAQWQSLPAALRDELEKIPDAKVFQWVVSAAKTPDESHQVVLQEAQRQLEVLRQDLMAVRHVAEEVPVLRESGQRMEDELRALARALSEERSAFAQQLGAERESFARQVRALEQVSRDHLSNIEQERSNFAQQLAVERASFALQVQALEQVSREHLANFELERSNFAQQLESERASFTQQVQALEQASREHLANFELERLNFAQQLSVQEQVSCDHLANFELERSGFALQLNVLEQLLRDERSNFAQQLASEQAGFAQQLSLLEQALADERASSAQKACAEQLRTEGQTKLAADYCRRAMELDNQLQAMRASKSWRITAPLRLAFGTLYIGWSLLKKIRGLPKLCAKKFYFSLPQDTRYQIKDTLFNELPWIFRRTVAYREWLSWKKIPVGGDTPDLQLVRDALETYADSDTQQYEQQIYRAALEVDALRLIAFYLPQFHPIPENDDWWGKGFTEWTNVSKAQPQFAGHYQPHLPGELGFYDLRVPEVMQRQVELAKIAGLAGFCFHYYWFAGRRLLERPLDMYLANPALDLPFCLCWANENWSRRWDGMENDILMQQTHTPETDEAFIRDVTPILMDPRYIRVDGKPVLILYRVTLLPDARATVQRWREYFAAQNLGELYLVAAQSFDVEDPRVYGFDAAVEFPPHGIRMETINQEVELCNPGYAGRIYDYREMAKHFADRWADDYVLHKSVVPSWDNEARKPGLGSTFIHSSPDRYAAWLRGVCQGTVQRYHQSQRLVFVNAWNEWAEGAHLEPDRRYGYAWLNRTREVLVQYSPERREDTALQQIQRSHDVAVIVHLYYPELFMEIAARLAPLANELDLYVSVREGALDYCRELIHKVFPRAVVVAYPNRGRDVLPFLNIYRSISGLGYKAICKLHTKKSTHRQDGALWRQDVYDKLIGSVERIHACVAMLQDAGDAAHGEKMGVVGPAGHVLDSSHYWALNKDRVGALAQEMGCTLESIGRFFFVAGTMFWFRPEALAPLMALDLPDAAFEPESGQVDGTLAHAVERLIGLSCQKAGYQLGEFGVLGGGHRAAKPTDDSIDYAYAVKT